MTESLSTLPEGYLNERLERQRWVYEQRQARRTYQVIADELGVTKERVRQLEARWQHQLEMIELQKKLQELKAHEPFLSPVGKLWFSHVCACMFELGVSVRTAHAIARHINRPRNWLLHEIGLSADAAWPGFDEWFLRLSREAILRISGIGPKSCDEVISAQNELRRRKGS